MLTADIVRVLGLLFGLLVYVMAMTQVARREAKAKQRAEKGAPAATEKAR